MELERIVEEVMETTLEQETEKLEHNAEQERKQEVEKKEKTKEKKASFAPSDKEYEERMHEQERKQEAYRQEAAKTPTVTGNQQVIAMAENLKSQNVENPYLTAYIQRARNEFNTGTEKVLDRETGHTIDKVEADKTHSMTEEVAKEDVTQTLYQQEQSEAEEDEEFEI